MCLFCRIASGETPAQIVFEDRVSMAFLDHRPLFAGHCLLIPRVHLEALSDLTPELIGPLFANVRALAIAVQESMDAAGSFVAMNNRVSQSVPHFHVHVVPRRPKDGLRGFFWPRTRYGSESEMAEVCERIQKALAALG